MGPVSHFNQRCRERGIVQTCPDKLFEAIRRAVKAYDRGEPTDFVELVMANEAADSRIWRFFCDDGIFYAVTPMDGQRPMTILTQKMVAAKKAALKARKRGLKFDRNTRKRKEGRREARRGGVEDRF